MLILAAFACAEHNRRVFEEKQVPAVTYSEARGKCMCSPHCPCCPCASCSTWLTLWSDAAEITAALQVITSTLIVLLAQRVLGLAPASGCWGSVSRSATSFRVYFFFPIMLPFHSSVSKEGRFQCHPVPAPCQCLLCWSTAQWARRTLLLKQKIRCCQSGCNGGHNVFLAFPCFYQAGLCMDSVWDSSPLSLRSWCCFCGLSCACFACRQAAGTQRLALGLGLNRTEGFTTCWPGSWGRGRILCDAEWSRCSNFT